ncbi:hypothetical protein F444_13227 [Phytophthora nicotianae P1976]|uniref:Uncharacterized protein n=1 Tax=Phytophthora nicotianae P1976 TaxID=1317066 RepID=A0A080ZUG4_PHYNI|nr:hypothetical protein F444_13227 [Phytophthora nicotianae P1976]
MEAAALVPVVASRPSPKHDIDRAVSRQEPRPRGALARALRDSFDEIAPRRRRANTEQTRQLHTLLLKLSTGKWVDADIATLIDDLQNRNSHLLLTNRTLRSYVSLARLNSEVLVPAVEGMRAGELDLSALNLGQQTSVALQRIQAATAESLDPHALPAALTRAAHQDAPGKYFKRLRSKSSQGSDEG